MLFEYPDPVACIVPAVDRKDQRSGTHSVTYKYWNIAWNYIFTIFFPTSHSLTFPLQRINPKLLLARQDVVSQRAFWLCATDNNISDDVFVWTNTLV